MALPVRVEPPTKALPVAMPYSPSASPSRSSALSACCIGIGSSQHVSEDTVAKYFTSCLRLSKSHKNGVGAPTFTALNADLLCHAGMSHCGKVSCDEKWNWTCCTPTEDVKMTSCTTVSLAASATHSDLASQQLGIGVAAASATPMCLHWYA